nr:MAG: hypothetical protein 1 [Leviviridae sp.]
MQNLGSHESITDEVMKGDGHNLTINKLTVTGMVVKDQKYGGSITGSWWKNCQPDFVIQENSSLYFHPSIPGRPTNEMLAAKLLAETNPSRPVVDMPLFIYELREVPDLLRKEGGDWVRKLASLNLKYHFGIKPLVNDLASLLSFSDEVAKRQKELEALAKSGLRRKRHLWDGSTTESRNVTVNSTNRALLHVRSENSCSSQVWGFVNWFLENPEMMKGDSRALAKKCVLGMTIDFATAWNAMPWSWLVDWCSNVGDILIAKRNLVGASHGPVQIMETVKSSAVCRSESGDPGLEPGTWERITKTRRTVADVSPSAQLPILSLRQLSILGSIGVTRRVPRNP